MSIPVRFFEGASAHFFLPFARSRREKYLCAVKAIYARLHGPDSFGRERFDREAVLEVLQNAIAQAPDEVETVLSGELIEAGELTPARCLKTLEDHGWLASHLDTVSVTKVWTFTLAGRDFARTFFERDQVRHASSHHYMRACEAHLNAYLASGDPSDLLDAEDKAARVYDELSDVVADFQERGRAVFREAHQRHSATEGFVHFVLERFAKDIDPKLTSDSAARLEKTIRDHLEALRNLPDGQLQSRDAALRARMLNAADYPGSPMLATADRIERMVHGAVDSRIPELIRVTSKYVERMLPLIRASGAVQGSAQAVLRQFLEDLRALEDSGREAVLDAIALLVSPSAMDLYDPRNEDFELERVREIPPQSLPTATLDRESLLAANISLAWERHLTFSDEDSMAYVLEVLAARGGRARLSALPVTDARDLLLALSFRDALSALPEAPVEIRPTGERIETEYFSADDYEIVLLTPESAYGQ